MPCRCHRAAQLPQFIGIRAPGGSGIAAAALTPSLRPLTGTHNAPPLALRHLCGSRTPRERHATLVPRRPHPRRPEEAGRLRQPDPCFSVWAEFARSCGLRVAIPRTGRFGVICSRLGCNAPHVDRRDFGEKPEADFEATYVGGAGARCATKRTRDCRLADPRCIQRANEISQIKSDALRNILDIHHPARNASCSDGSVPPATPMMLLFIIECIPHASKGGTSPCSGTSTTGP